MKKLEYATTLADSAARIYDYIEKRWASMSKEQRQELYHSNCAPIGLRAEIDQVDQHRTYCIDLKSKAATLIKDYNLEEAEIKTKQEEVQRIRDEEAREAAERAREKKIYDDSHLIEVQEQAERLISEAKDILLGQNLERQKLAPAGAAASSKSRSAAAPKVRETGEDG